MARNLSTGQIYPSQLYRRYFSCFFIISSLNRKHFDRFIFLKIFCANNNDNKKIWVEFQKLVIFPKVTNEWKCVG